MTRPDAMTREMDDLRFVVEHRPPQVVIGNSPFDDQLELITSLRAFEPLLDLLDLLIEAKPLRTLWVCSQDEYGPHQFSPSTACHNLATWFGNILHRWVFKR